jgi:hypothetical protein
MTWRHGIGCEREHPECFFLPVSSCNLTHVHDLMEKEAISYVELFDSATVESLPKAGADKPRVVVARGKLGWLLSFRKNLPVGAALDAIGISADVRDNKYFGAESSAYVKSRMWHMQAALYVLRLNKVGCLGHLVLVSNRHKRVPTNSSEHLFPY